MYKCECNKEFDSAQSFNGHKSHCKVHLIHVGKYADFILRKAKYINILQDYNKTNTGKATKSERQFICEKCGKHYSKLLTDNEFLKIKHCFCSRSCANSHSYTDEMRDKVRKTMTNSEAIKVSVQNQKDIAKNNYLANPNYCKVCGKMLSYESRTRKTCSDNCLHEILHLAGVNSISHQADKHRSYGENCFAQKCKDYFTNVLTNEPIFNGWDADIILQDYKVAILYNGPWHYKEISKKITLAQIKNRDMLKAIEIEKAGYKLFIVEDIDNNGHNLEFIELEFKKLLEFMKKVEFDA